jgi:hypothetical protein
MRERLRHFLRSAAAFGAVRGLRGWLDSTFVDPVNRAFQVSAMGGIDP